jgi:CRISPR/Cas system-associated exonuclease Cas4 (RecB family)
MCPVTNFDSIIKVEFNDDGSFAGVSRTINDDKISRPVSVEINNGALYVANTRSYTVDKISLGATIEIPAMSSNKQHYIKRI